MNEKDIELKIPADTEFSVALQNGFSITANRATFEDDFSDLLRRATTESPMTCDIDIRKLTTFRINPGDLAEYMAILIRNRIELQHPPSPWKSNPYKHLAAHFNTEAKQVTGVFPGANNDSVILLADYTSIDGIHPDYYKYHFARQQEAKREKRFSPDKIRFLIHETRAYITIHTATMEQDLEVAIENQQANRCTEDIDLAVPFCYPGTFDLVDIATTVVNSDRVVDNILEITAR